MSYRQVLDTHGMGALIKPPQIPDYHLMIGSAERLDGMPLMVYTDYTVPKQVVSGWEQYKEMTQEDIEQKINDNTLEVNDFNMNLYYLGGGLGGV